MRRGDAKGAKRRRKGDGEEKRQSERVREEKLT